jgi:L-fuconolactonase
MRIDAHQHFWRLDRGDYGWLTPDVGVLYCDHGPEMLRPLLDAAGIDCTILVQAAPTEAETQYLLGIAAQHAWVAGVVGWVDLASPDAPQRIQALAANPKLVGVRPMLQDLDDPEWILRADVRPGLRALAIRGLTLDALIRPHQLRAITRVAEAVPTLAIVVDHAAKPEIADLPDADWRRDIEAAAELPNVSVKLSGLLTQAGAGAGNEHLGRYLDVVLQAFGPSRILWGSDWPVLNLAADYGAWCAITDQLLAHMEGAKRSAILGGNAARIYGIPV